jgi:Trp operon repressor
VSEKEKLITRIRILSAIHKTKQEAWQKEKGMSSECGCITRESCIIASLYPEMQRLGVTFNDITYAPETFSR